MVNFISQEALLIFPELAILAISILVLFIGLFRPISSDLAVKSGVILTIIVSYVYFINFDQIEGRIFSNTYISNYTTYLIKSLFLGLLSFYLISYLGYFQSISRKYNYEYLFILLVSILGGFIVISSSNFIPLYLGIELMSLCFYVLAAFDRDKLKSSEAGLKYFALGAFSSCLMLFGLSFIYGISGSLDFTVISDFLAPKSNIMIIAGVIIFLCGIIFKLSLVPFHFWTPDVYDGSPLLTVTLFSSLAKFPTLFFTILAINRIFQPIEDIYFNIINFIIIASLLVGSIGAIMQKSIKRLIGYSTIMNIGFALIGVILGQDGSNKSIIYLFIYSVSIIGFFTILYMLLGKEAEDATIYDIQGLAKLKKFGAAGIAFIMFSLIGIPPFAGFFAKYIILYDTFKEGFYIIFSIAILSTLISAYYYLKIISMLYFNKPKILQRASISEYSMAVALSSFIFITFFSILPIKDFINYKMFI